MARFHVDGKIEDILKKCQNMTFKVNSLISKTIRIFQIFFIQFRSTFFDNFNSWHPLFSKMMPNFWSLSTMSIPKNSISSYLLDNPYCHTAALHSAFKIVELCCGWLKNVQMQWLEHRRMGSGRSYSLRRPQNFVKSPPYFCLHYIRQK